MRGVHIFMFIAALPALAALGHDAFLYSQNPDRGFMLSALGFLWTHYHPESYKWAAETLPQDQWTILNRILAYKAVAVGAAFAGVFYILLALLRILGVWPYSRKFRHRFHPLPSTSGPIKYKRK
ncbi:MAG: hypothetical protein K9G62_04800 [Alphaproteobacteria bacterium]|nr:hypothetical protein [Alphaproteobacteria bacterium]